MSILDNKKCLVFDLDGTIVKLGVDWVVCRQEARAALIAKYPQLEAIFNNKAAELEAKGKKFTVEIMGLVADEVLGREVFVDFEAIQERHETTFNLPEMKIFTEIVEFIKNYQGSIEFAICSNNTLPGIKYSLDYVGITDKFSVIEPRQPGRPPKPDPQIIEDLMKQYNFEVKDYLFVGNNQVTDGGTAETMGMDYIDYQDFIKEIQL